jgi:hypothetical protein
LEVVESHNAGKHVDYGGVLPAGQLQQQAFSLAAEELRLAVDRLNQAQTLAGCDDGGVIVDAALDRYDVGHSWWFSLCKARNAPRVPRGRNGRFCAKSGNSEP